LRENVRCIVADQLNGFGVFVCENCDLCIAFKRACQVIELTIDAREDGFFGEGARDAGGNVISAGAIVVFADRPV